MTTRSRLGSKKKSRAFTTGVEVLLLVGVMFSVLLVPSVTANVGFSDNWILVERWRFDMHWYSWGYFGASPAIADLGPDVNIEGGEPDSDLEIATGSDEHGAYYWELGGAYATGIWRALDSGGNLEWARNTETDEARSSLAIADIDGDGDLEMAGGTTSGWMVEVLNHTGGFVWTFPKIWVSSLGGADYVWPSSPALADLDPDVSGLELVIGNRWLGNVWAFDGDNSDGIDDGITISQAADFTLDTKTYPYPLGTEGIDWDVLWKFDTGGSVWSSPAVGDVDNDGTLEVVIGSVDSNVYVLDGPSGSLEHAFSTGGAVSASAALANLDDDAYLEIVIGSFDGNVYAFQWDGTTTGSTEWMFSTGGYPVYSSAAIGDVDLDGGLEIVVGSTNSRVYSLDSSGDLEWNYATGGAVYSSPALADRGSVATYDADWPMFRHDARRTGFYGAAPDTGLDVYVGSDDNYLYLISGTSGLMIDRFEVYGYSGKGIHTSPSVADVDGDNLFDIFFYDWGKGSTYSGHTFWALKDTGCTAPPAFGSISGTVTVSCFGSPVADVEIDLYDAAGPFISSTTTATDGTYSFPDLTPGDYTVTIVLPTGYVIPIGEESVPATVVAGEDTVVDFVLQFALVGEGKAPRTIGYWKHQVNAYLTGKGKPHETGGDMLLWLGAIGGMSAQFAGITSLEEAQGILNLGKGASMEDRAREQLLALWLNVVSGKLATHTTVDLTGFGLTVMTVSEAIQYCEDNLTANPELVKDIADAINNGDVLVN